MPTAPILLPEEPEEGPREGTFTDDSLAETLEQDYTPPGDQPQGQVISYQPDVHALEHAQGDSGVWAAQLSGLVEAITGSTFSPETLQGWLDGFGRQVEQRAYRAALFQVANTQLPAQVAGEPSLLLLSLRDEIASSFRRQAA